MRKGAIVLAGVLLIIQGLVALAGRPTPFTRTLKGIQAPEGFSWGSAVFGMISLAAGIGLIRLERR